VGRSLPVTHRQHGFKSFISHSSSPCTRPLAGSAAAVADCAPPGCVIAPRPELEKARLFARRSAASYLGLPSTSTAPCLRSHFTQALSRVARLRHCPPPAYLPTNKLIGGLIPVLASTWYLVLHADVQVPRCGKFDNQAADRLVRWQVCPPATVLCKTALTLCASDISVEPLLS
jgi:hypothetical protein